MIRRSSPTGTAAGLLVLWWPVLWWLALCWLALGWLVGCGGPPAEPAAEPTAPELTAEPAAEAASERASEAASEPAAAVPQRVIALAPAAVEILFTLGLGDRVVGVGDYSAWPPEVEELPRLGGLFDPRLELIVSLEPELAVLTPSEGELGEELSRLGVEVLTVPSETLDDVETAMRLVGRRFGVEGRAEELIADWREALAPRPSQSLGGPRVLLLVGRQPGSLSDLLVVGPDTFLSELLARLGAENIFSDAPTRYPQVGLEEVLVRRPEVIVELSAEQPSREEAAQLLADWHPYRELLPAVAQGRVVVLAGSHTLLPGPRLPRLYQELRTVLAPPGDRGGGDRREGGDRRDEKATDD